MIIVLDVFILLQLIVPRLYVSHTPNDVVYIINRISAAYVTIDGGIIDAEYIVYNKGEILLHHHLCFKRR